MLNFTYEGDIKIKNKYAASTSISRTFQFDIGKITETKRKLSKPKLCLGCPAPLSSRSQ
jgi:hypothetical protein